MGKRFILFEKSIFCVPRWLEDLFYWVWVYFGCVVFAWLTFCSTGGESFLSHFLVSFQIINFTGQGRAKVPLTEIQSLTQALMCFLLWFEQVNEAARVLFLLENILEYRMTWLQYFFFKFFKKNQFLVCVLTFFLVCAYGVASLCFVGCCTPVSHWLVEWNYSVSCVSLFTKWAVWTSQMCVLSSELISDSSLSLSLSLPLHFSLSNPDTVTPIYPLNSFIPLSSCWSQPILLVTPVSPHSAVFRFHGFRAFDTK